MESAGRRTNTRGPGTGRESVSWNKDVDKKGNRKGKRKLERLDEQEDSNKKPRKDENQNQNTEQGSSQPQPQTEPELQPQIEPELQPQVEPQSQPQPHQVPWPTWDPNVANPSIIRPQHHPGPLAPSPTVPSTPSLVDSGESQPEDIIPEGQGISPWDDDSWMMDP